MPSCAELPGGVEPLICIPAGAVDSSAWPPGAESPSCDGLSSCDTLVASCAELPSCAGLPRCDALSASCAELPGCAKLPHCDALSASRVELPNCAELPS